MKTIDLQTELSTAVPLLTKKDKLLRWAELVRGSGHPAFLFHLMEHWNEDMLRQSTSRYVGQATAMSIAASDPVLQAAGLAGDSARQAMDFFELTQHDLHAFSCDCGGHITNAGMADRITSLAK